MVLAAASAILLSGIGCAGPTPESTGRTVLLLVADTWRGDHWLAVRGENELTPGLAAFANTAEIFSDASSVSNCTSPGMAGILTGLSPHRSTVDRNRSILPDGLPNMATMLREAGFRTAAFVGNPVLRRGMGFDQGFETFEWVEKREERSKTRADQLLEKSSHWLDGISPEEDAFLWLHLLEPHGPYRPPAELSRLFPVSIFGEAREAALLPKGNNTGDGGIPHYQHGPIEPSTSDIRHYLASYAAEVRATDDAIMKLFEQLDRRGRLENAIVIVTSDHGEALEDDFGKYFSHENGLSADQLRVPLLIRYPGCEKGAVHDRPVSTNDILPTVLRLLGISTQAEIDGVDLRDESPRRMMFGHQGKAAIRQGPWQLTRLTSGREVLFDLRHSPEIVVARDARTRAMRIELRAALDAALDRPPLATPRLRPATRQSAKRDG